MIDWLRRWFGRRYGDIYVVVDWTEREIVTVDTRIQGAELARTAWMDLYPDSLISIINEDVLSD